MVKLNLNFLIFIIFALIGLFINVNVVAPINEMVNLKIKFLF
jgi:hypothetical protein